MAGVTYETEPRCSAWCCLSLLVPAHCAPCMGRALCVRRGTNCTLTQRTLLGLELYDEHALKVAVLNDRLAAYWLLLWPAVLFGGKGIL